LKLTKLRLKQIIKEELSKALNEIGFAAGFESLEVPDEIYDIVGSIVGDIADTADDAKEAVAYIARHLSKALNIEEAIIVNFINEYTPRKANEDVVILMNVISHNIAEYLEKNDDLVDDEKNDDLADDAYTDGKNHYYNTDNDKADHWANFEGGKYLEDFQLGYQNTQEQDDYDNY
jgi:hypothetical protein